MNQESNPAQETSPRQGSRFVVGLCNHVIQWTILGLAFLVPVFFLPWTIEVSELNKQLLLVAGSVIAGTAWFGRMLAERRFEYRRSVVNIMVGLFVAVYGLSTWLSVSPYMSVMGDLGQEMGSFVTVLSLAMLYFVVANNLRSMRELYGVVTALTLGGLLVAAFSFLQVLGVYLLPFEFAKTAAFNPIGTPTMLGIYLSFTATLSGGLILMGHRSGPNRSRWLTLNTVLAGLTGTLSIIMVAFIDYWPVTLCMLSGSALLIVFSFIHAKSMKGISGVMLPIVGTVVALLLLLFAFPVKLNQPAEVLPSVRASYDITVSTLREHPFLGSGPGTFLYDYAKHRSEAVNSTAFWDVRFDRGANNIMTMMATTGLLGTLSWLLMAAFMLFLAGRKLLRSDEDTWHLLIGGFAAWLPLLLARFLYSSSMTLEFLFWILLGVLVAVHKPRIRSIQFDDSPRAAMGVSFIFILGVVFAVSGVFVAGTRYAGEIAYAKAIRSDQAGGGIDETVAQLQRAVKLNGNNDVYTRNLAMAYLAKADEELNRPMDITKQEANEESGIPAETDEEFNARVQAEREQRVRDSLSLTGQAVNIAKHATEINPNNVANWTVLANVYGTLLGVSEDADQWAIAAHEKAIELESSSPVYYAEIGKIMLFQSDRAKKLADAAKGEEAKAEAEGLATDLLNKAVEQLNKAIELKADYAVARYNLATALDRQDKLDEAITKMEEVIAINQQDVGVAFQLALMYYRDDRKDNAVDLLAQVVRLQPRFANARWYLAAMLEERGMLDEAIVQVKAVQELNQGNADVDRKLSELEGKKNQANQPVPPPQAENAGGDTLPEPVSQPVENANEPTVGQ